MESESYQKLGRQIKKLNTKELVKSRRIINNVTNVDIHQNRKNIKLAFLPYFCSWKIITVSSNRGKVRLSLPKQSSIKDIDC